MTSILPWLIGLASGVAILWLVRCYNGLVRSRILVREAFSGIDVQLKRRHELIPNLVRVVAAYTQHEASLLQKVSQLRGEAVRAMRPAEKEAAEAALNSELIQVVGLVESYPALRSDDQYLELMRQLSEVEDDLQKSRRYYNGTVRDLNTRVESFPSNLVARLFGFSLESYFSLDRLSEALVPKIQLGEPRS
jgi:LemA protein